MSRRSLISLLTLFILCLILGIFWAQVYFQPRVVIVPHHDLVKLARQTLLMEVAHRRPHTQTILLLSPDHFNPNQRQIISSDQAWTTPLGLLAYDQALGQSLTTQVINDPAAVKNDHGIVALLTDLKTAFPHARLVPLLLGQALNAQDLKPLAQVISQTCLSDCLIVASVDFSHYLPASLANVHDAYSLTTLSTTNLSQIQNLEVDSPQALYLALSHALYHHSPRFVLKNHTNSGILVNNFDIETTSHLLGWYQPGPLNPRVFQTFVIANGLFFNPNQKTVNDRFFYGADYTDTNLSNSWSPATNLIIQPASSSALIYSNHHLTINLAKDLSVAGTVSPTGAWLLTLMPLTGTDQHRTLAIGDLKNAALSRHFANLPALFKTDTQRGTVSYTPASAPP